MAKLNEVNWETHQWSGWPGAFCMECFIEDPVELAVAENRENEYWYCPPCLPGKVKAHE